MLFGAVCDWFWVRTLRVSWARVSFVVFMVLRPSPFQTFVLRVLTHGTSNKGWAATKIHCLNPYLVLSGYHRSAPVSEEPRAAFLYTFTAMMRHFRTLLTLAMVSCWVHAIAQQSSFTVGTATAAAGQKATGYIEVPAGVDAATSIPVVVVQGSKSGPVLALLSGAHGTEYASVIALEKLIPMLDPTQISGTVIILPLVNIQSFLQKVPHVNPVDGKSMN